MILTEVSCEGARNLHHLSNRETSTKQKSEYLHCDLLLFFKDFQYNKAFSNTPRTATVQQIDATWQVTKWNYRQKRSKVLAPYTLSKSRQQEMVCCPGHKTGLNDHGDEEWLPPVQLVPNIKRQTILASESFRIPVLRTIRHTNTHRPTHTQM